MLLILFNRDYYIRLKIAFLHFFNHNLKVQNKFKKLQFITYFMQFFRTLHNLSHLLTETKYIILKEILGIHLKNSSLSQKA